MEQTIKLLPYSALHYDDLVGYELDEDQKPFTISPKENLKTLTILAEPEKTPVTIALQDKAVGFFILDSGPDKQQLTENPNALLLRSLSINPHYQGKGYGKQAMTICDEYVQDYLKSCDEIVLSVNLKNTRAYQMYLKAGFTDTGNIIGGKNGLQHVMAKVCC